ncbi:MAG: galactose-1-phosphate uridylyltransferase [Meiothermus sp.]|uniref:galactose-1-phosphate uridylyltransferase n=1 Tax=Meiothermus sp. TaxID=1955249 RepID=UPI0025D03B1A|nr:galactose-1-phosphate uridylyltransferase [Meiothermus sp.]MCS7057823.1 galactose-1-phosphate uridylyltransferase [Meiothermus sp.]MCS7194567.1 galactose-1-phosphate uridylyltransferase [Meiothermus sp.]MCX7741321.1 galactose-1-phosphate uridylyltransferase [Meiothermus sp.]MDW8091965.1 galactose-1-phosphate uridylyltransferase [Meiothermus sp.]MDW8481818.1 galactose-1-phosphate uridylyltransferase [Meiothermus sp.]
MTQLTLHKRVYRKKDGRMLYLYGRQPHTLPPLEEGELVVEPRSHARWHPLRQEWVVFAASRQGRTFLPPKEYDPLAPSKRGGFPTEIPFEDFEVAVFQNRWPALSPEAGEPPLGLPIPTRDARGDCEVVVFTPEDSGSLATLSPERRELLVQVWADRYQELYGREAIRFVMPFENRGEPVGVTLHHPHGQIYAYPWLPPVLQKELEAFQKGPVLQELLPHLGPYTVWEDEHTLACVPPFARYPYEVWVFPRAFRPGPWAFSPAETRSLAQALGQVVAKLDGLFQKPMPYVMALHAAPKGAEAVFHFHIEFYPALRTADKLKYLAGTEVAAGTFAMDALPEETALALREVPT